MTVPRNPHRARLAARLRALRAATGSSGNQFAQQLGWPQPRVSKLETGRQLPTDDDLQAWLTAVSAGKTQATELAELLSAARIEYATCEVFNAPLEDWPVVTRSEPPGRPRLPASRSINQQ